jgi:hypothetical protein
MATFAHGGPALAQASRSSRTATKPEAPKPASAPVDSTAAAAANKAPSAEAKALANVLRERYPDRLTPEELQSITKDFDGDLQGMKRLRETKLANSDEPDVTFHA